MIITFFTTSVDVCTGSFCFCCTAIVVDAYRREILDAAVLFSLSCSDRLFRCFTLSAAVVILLLLILLLMFALSRFAELRRLFRVITGAAVVEALLVVVVFSLLLRINRVLRDCG